MAQWNAPQVIDDVTAAYPANVKALMPKMSEIPEDFHYHGSRGGKWVKFQSDWFFNGIDGEGLIPKPGIDKNAALRHLGAINRSFKPKHEHKLAAVAYLASLWFEENSTWTKLKVDSSF